MSSGFVASAWLVGSLAERRADRSIWKAFLALQAGSLAIFACGLTGLMLTLDVSLARAAELGWYPFILGDLLKTAAAALLLPGTWHFVDRATRSPAD